MPGINRDEKPLTEPGADDYAEEGVRMPAAYWDMPEDLSSKQLSRYLRGVTKRTRESRAANYSVTEALFPSTRQLTKPDDWDRSSAKRHKVQNTSRNLYFKNELARNAINNFVFFTLGAGVRFEYGSSQDPDAARAEERVREMEQTSQLDHLIRQMFTMVFALGEWLLVEPDMDPDEERKAATFGILGVRPLDPTRVREIELEGGDPLSPHAYKLDASGLLGRIGMGKKELPARRVIHYAINRFGVHGRPLLEPVLQRILQIHDMIEDRVAISGTRSHLPIIRYVKGLTSPPAAEQPPRRTVISANMDRERWEYPTLNLGGAEYIEELRDVTRTIAQALSIPEFLITQDLSQAGSMGQLPITEIQAVKVFRHYQRQLEEPLKELAHRIAPWIDRERIKIVFEDPDFTTKDRKADIAERLFRAGFISQQTAQEIVGVDPDEEARRLEQERVQVQQAAATLPTPTPTPTPPAESGPASVTDQELPPGLSAEEFELPPLPGVDMEPGVGEKAPPEAGKGGGKEGGITLPQFGEISFKVPLSMIRLGQTGGGLRLASALRERDANTNSTNASTSTSTGVPFERTVAGMDFGYDQPGAVVVVGRTPLGRYVVVEEHVQAGFPLRHPENGAKEPARSCCWICLLKQLQRRYGLDALHPDPRDPEAIDTLRNDLPCDVEARSIGVDEGLETVVKLAGEGRLLIHHSCTALRDDLRKGEGHAYDALKYALLISDSEDSDQADSGSEGNN